MYLSDRTDRYFHMSEKFALNLVYNNLSFGQVSYGITHEIFKRGLSPNISLIANQAELGAQAPTKEFQEWFLARVNGFLTNHSRKTPIFKLWHLNGSLESYSNEQTLFTFHELDNLTPIEQNIARNQKKILLSSQYSADVFKAFGIDATYVPLFFDSNTFKEQKVVFPDDRIIFTLGGKLEKRKGHFQVLRAWAKKYGNDKRYALNMAIHNNFLKPEDQAALLHQIFEGKKYWNINPLPFMPQNSIFNNFLNSGHIHIGASYAEGWDLVSFHATALGKHAVILNAHAYKGWATENNAVLFNPNGKEAAVDGVFFHPNTPFNQGTWFTWNDDEFIAACDKAIERYKENPTNVEGKKLQTDFTVANTVDKILENL